ncbi:MAG TPA: hypothetical protein VF794_27730 [Archangium sp.]|jgi:hypothetical protein|uniref:hypothetical protein n=1 Tax=Archangium sp. TaxID=1872627 RepID=UPI002ED84DC5
MSTKTLRGFNPFGNLKTKRADVPAAKTQTKNEPAKNELAKPAQKGMTAEGRYQNSYNAGQQVNRDYKKTLKHGDTSDLFTPNSKPSKLGNALGLIPNVTLKEGSFEKRVAAKEVSGSFSNKYAQGAGSIAYGEAYAKGDYKVSLEGGALKATGSAEAAATLVHAKGTFHAGKGDYTLDASGEAYVGVKANVSGELTIDPAKGIYAAKVGGEAFAGAKIGVEANVNLGKFGGVGAKAEAWAGAGVAFNAELGFKGGRFKAKVDIGAALGIGFKIGFSVDIDLKGIKDAVKNVAKKVIEAPVEAIKSVGKSIANGLKKLKFW